MKLLLWKKKRGRWRLSSVIRKKQRNKIMTKVNILAILKKTGGYITDSHIVYTSGKHGEAYLNKDAIYPHTFETSKVCKAIAEKFKNKKIEVVVAPALGGIILSQWTAYHLSKLTKKEVVGIYTEKTSDKNQILTRGYDKLVKKRRVLIVEDITTTGGSVAKVIKSVKEAGGKITGVCVLVNRNPEEVNAKALGVPYFKALSQVKMQAWDEKECPLCKKGIPINTTVGKGREYLARKA
ncbi:orotate phosphoribosyltransferase [Candidatus Gottesmanbacteria bacterium]|nr:orotate phosphoribosyltransferase [Candidatus Gottesmanbacteria bacterium]